MTLFTIDHEKCDKDGICALECPAHIIEMTDNGPVPAAGAEEICIQCGHCVAVCPRAALSLNFLSPEDCMPLNKDLALDAAHTEHFLRSRRAVRRYRDKPVPRDLFEKATGIACCAPTGSNCQEVQWRVIDHKDDVRKIAAHVIEWMRHLVKTRPELALPLNMQTLIQHWEQGSDRICRDAPSWCSPMHPMNSAARPPTAIRHWPTWNLPCPDLAWAPAGLDMSIMRPASGLPLPSFYPFLKTIPATGH